MASAKLYAILVYGAHHDMDYSNYNLEDFFFLYRSKIREIIESTVKKILPYIKKDTVYYITDMIDEHPIAIYGSSYDRYHIIITNDYYPKHIGYQLLNALKTSNNVVGLFDAYADPIQVDKLLTISREIDETKKYSP